MSNWIDNYQSIIFGGVTITKATNFVLRMQCVIIALLRPHTFTGTQIKQLCFSKIVRCLKQLI